MKGLALYLTGMSFMSGLLWMTDTVILWAIGFVGVVLFLPPAVSAWIGHFVEKSRKAQGKPGGNVAVIFAVAAGICLAATVVYGLINFDVYNKNGNFGYAFLTLFIASPILLAEFVGMLIAAIAKSKQPPRNYDYSSMYVNPLYNNMPNENMYQNNMPYNNPQDGNDQNGMYR